MLRLRNVIAAFALAVSCAAVAQQNAAPKPITRSGMAAQLNGAFAAADTNHDGFLSVAEITAVEKKEIDNMNAQLRAQNQSLFRQLDTNKDGQLSPQEFAAAATTAKLNKSGAEALQKLDTNHDGKVSAAEFSAQTLARFDKTDLNHDGIVTPDEGRRASAPK